LKGTARRFREKNIIPQFDNYTAIWHRVSKFVPKIKLPTEKELEVATDGTGMRVSNGGDTENLNTVKRWQEEICSSYYNRRCKRERNYWILMRILKVKVDS